MEVARAPAPAATGTALEEAGRPYEQGRLSGIDRPTSPRRAADWTMRWTASKRRPGPGRRVPAASDVIAASAMQELRTAGTASTDQVAVISFDDSIVARHTDPPMTERSPARSRRWAGPWPGCCSTRSPNAARRQVVLAAELVGAGLGLTAEQRGGWSPGPLSLVQEVVRRPGRRSGPPGGSPPRAPPVVERRRTDAPGRGLRRTAGPGSSSGVRVRSCQAAPEPAPGRRPVGAGGCRWVLCDPGPGCRRGVGAQRPDDGHLAGHRAVRALDGDGDGNSGARPRRVRRRRPRPGARGVAVAVTRPSPASCSRSRPSPRAARRATAGRRRRR